MKEYADIAKWLRSIDYKYWGYYDIVWEIFSELFDMIDPGCNHDFNEKMYSSIVRYMNAIIESEEALRGAGDV